jgi:uncharacterized protein (DUF849 family)
MPDYAKFASERVIVMAAPNGARRTRDEHPAVPLTAGELADCAADLLDAGVSVLHLHVRDTDGGHTLDVDRYRAAIDAVRRRVGDRLIVQVTSESVGMYSAAEQMAMVTELRPEAVSLGLKELCPDPAAEAEAAAFFAGLARNGTWPQYILYSADELRRFDALRRRGIFGDDRPFCLLVLGRYAESLEGDPGELDAMLSSIDEPAFPWAVCCFGRHENAAMRIATERGGHVRIGFENNLLLADGTVASDNAELIRQYVESTSDSGRLPASADEIRETWQL